MNIVILWELNGIKSTEKQYIITVYQIDTNSISVQSVEPISSVYMKVVANPKQNRRLQYPTLDRYGV